MPGNRARVAPGTLPGYHVVMGQQEAIDRAATAETDRGAVRRSTSYAADKARIQARLRRMEGQIRGVQRMIDQDQYCVDVLTQISAVIAAARTVGLLVLQDHIRGCVIGADATTREDRLDELNEAIERFTRAAG